MTEQQRWLRFCSGYVIIACAAAYRWLPMAWHLNSIVAGVLCQQAINIAYSAGVSASSQRGPHERKL